MSSVWLIKQSQKKKRNLKECGLGCPQKIYSNGG